MNYLVNKYTKEHVVWPDTVPATGADWCIVEADSEGWIAHTGDECPLPYDVRCEVRCVGCSPTDIIPAGGWLWNIPMTGTYRITHYRPILTEKVQEPEPPPADYRDDLVSRLKAAHEAAQTIPDLESELREVLAGMGYDLVARSPFVEPEAAVEPDMSDWRNWREGSDG